MSLWDVGSFLIDPLNISGIQDLNDNPQRMPSEPQAPSDYHVPATPTVKPMGFLESLGAPAYRPQRFGDPSRRMPDAPPPQWTYTPGQGVTWGTPSRIGTSTDFELKPNAVGSEGFNGFKGNRI